MRKIIECKKKGFVNLAYKQGLLFKELDKFKEIYKKMELVKIVENYRKTIENSPKLEVVMNFK